MIHPATSTAIQIAEQIAAMIRPLVGLLNIVIRIGQLHPTIRA